MFKVSVPVAKFSAMLEPLMLTALTKEPPFGTLVVAVRRTLSVLAPPTKVLVRSY